MRTRAFRSAQAVAAVVLMFSALEVQAAEDPAKARELFNQGNTFFDLGQFDKAIDAWQQGYQLHADPGFLYNIAQAYRTMGDAQKAIFFYKRYLINSPKAHNKADVEQKIEALQKQLSAQEPAKAPPPAPGPDNPSGASGGSTTPPPVSNPTPPPATTTPPEVTVTGTGTTPPPLESTAPAGAVVQTGATGGPEPPSPRIDLRVALGFDAWSSGLQPPKSAQPSFALTLAGGYTFGDASSRVRFRLGALFGYTFLKEDYGNDTFTSFLIDPTIVIRLTPKLTLMGDLGFGVMSISGLQKSSVLLSANDVTVNGSPALGVIRIGVAAEYDITRSVAVFLWPAYANSPKKQGFYQNIGRFEVLGGVTLRL